MPTRTRVSLEEFLAMPETRPPSELIDGEVIQKMAPNWSHSRLAALLAYELEHYVRKSREAEVHVEYRHLWDPEERVYLPDLNVTLRGRITVAMRKLAILPIQPDFALVITEKVTPVVEMMFSGSRLLVKASVLPPKLKMKFGGTTALTTIWSSAMMAVA
jgi:hypothetical protein